MFSLFESRMNLLCCRVTQFERLELAALLLQHFLDFADHFAQVDVVLCLRRPECLQRAETEVVNYIRDGLSQNVIRPDGSAKHLNKIEIKEDLRWIFSLPCVRRVFC